MLFIPLPQPEAAVDIYKDSEYFPVIQQLDKKLNPVNNTPVYKNNFEKWTAGVKDFFKGFSDKNASGGNGSTGDMIFMPETGTDDSVLEDSTHDTAGSNDYVETTDNQVQGVIEADRFKRTKTHIFYLYDETVYAYNIAGLDTELIHSYEIRVKENSYHNAGDDMYLSLDGKTLTVVRSISAINEQGKSNAYTEIVSLDVSDPTHISEKGRNYLSGSYVSSRMVDGNLLVINNFYVYKGVDFSKESNFLPLYGAWGDMHCVAADDIICPEELTTTNYSVICQIDENSAVAEDCMALLSYSSNLYASAENMFVTRTYNEKNDGVTQTKTDVACISYDDEGLEYVNSATVAGSVRNQYSMDEYEGIFRIVTTTNKGLTNASLYCIDMQTFETVGKVENFAPDGETVQSVRFDGDKAYVCTAIVITLSDPVYAFDLSDPANITYVDTGEIKGYSSSLVDFKDGFLLGIGYGANYELKIEIYQETATSVESVAVYELNAAFSENYKSYFIDRERGLIGLGVYHYGYPNEDFHGYILLQFDGYNLNEILRTELGGVSAFMRATLIDGYFYMFGGGALKDGEYGADYKVEKLY